MADPRLIDFRCPTPSCGRLLLKVSDIAGVQIETRCPRCKQEVAATLAAPDES